MIHIQDQQVKNGKAGRWTRTDNVMKVLLHSSYLFKVHCSRTLTQRNKRFLHISGGRNPVVFHASTWWKNPSCSFPPSLSRKLEAQAASLSPNDLMPLCLMLRDT